MLLNTNTRVAVIGLGYVGFPLGIALSKHFQVTGFDIKQQRVNDLRAGNDTTNEITSDIIQASRINLTYDPNELENQDIYIITVPTPVNNYNAPDLTPLKSACNLIGKFISKDNIVVLESTVYPGVTEDICGELLAQHSGLVCGADFFLGYSPERINPGDKKHTVETITKVISGQNEQTAKTLQELYNKVTNSNTFLAKSIKTAEAAKVIENTQRDINIAFINEITSIVNKLDLSIYDVLAAAQTKWNFLPFSPGLVGGHCIGVDPYYLAECAKMLNHEPEVILSGRNTNENMGKYFAYEIDDRLAKINNRHIAGRILVLGLTFKENIPDLRNSKVIDLINHLQRLKHQVDVHDPQADPIEAAEYYGIKLIDDLSTTGDYDCIVGAVGHAEYLQFEADDFMQLLSPSGLVFDIKRLWQAEQLPENCNYWLI